MKWFSSSEEYSSIGKIDYCFTLLNEARKNVPEPPAPQNYHTDDTAYIEIPIAAPYREVLYGNYEYSRTGNLVTRSEKVEQNTPYVCVGSIHHCTFTDFQATILPLRMTLSPKKFYMPKAAKL